jgi:hypothetical protein
MVQVPGAVPFEPDDPPPLQEPRPRARTSSAASNNTFCGIGFLPIRAKNKINSAKIKLTNKPNG